MMNGRDDRYAYACAYAYALVRTGQYACQSFGAAQLKERSPSVALDLKRL